MIKKLLIIFMLFTSPVYADVWYADPSGSDSPLNCTSGDPCTLSGAVETKASVGDTVILKAGTYTDSVTVSTSDITIKGVCTITPCDSANDDRLSIISPYTEIDTGWSTSADGIYTHATVGYKAWAMAIEVGGEMYKLPRLCQPSECSGGVDEMLELSASDSYKVGTYLQGKCTVNRWDGFEVFTSVTDGGVPSISFRDDDDPEIIGDVFIATDGDNTITVEANNVTIKDLEIHAKKRGIYTSGYSNLTIDNNKIIMGRIKIYALGTGTGLTVTDNLISDPWYGISFPDATTYVPGAWNVSNPPSLSGTSAQCIAAWWYRFGKTFTTPGSQANESTALWISTNQTDITVSGNEMSYMFENVNDMADGTVADNNIHDSVSTGFSTSPSTVGGFLYIYNNVFSNINATLRWQSWYKTNDLTIYVYNNQFWQIDLIGDNHNFFHDGNNSAQGGSEAEMWFYHNTAIGGRRWIDVSSGAKVGDVSMINNVVSINSRSGQTSRIWYGSGDPVLCEYNWQYVGSDDCADASNIDGSSDIWSGETTYGENGFPILPSGHAAIESGLDISVGFALDGTAYSALPGYDTDYYSGKPAPDMGITGNIGVNPPPLEQIVIDNDDSTATISTVSSGTWNFASGISGCYGNDCYFNWNSSDTDYYYFRTTHTGETKPYTAYSRWSYRPSRDTTTKYEVRDSTGVIATFTNIDQSVNDNQWNQLGTTLYQFTDWAEVRVYGNGGTNISVSADAVKFEGVTESIVPLSGIITVTSTNTGAEGSTASLSTSADSTGNMVGSLSVNAPPEDIGVRGDSIGVSTISGALGVAIGMGGSIDVSSTGDISGRVGCASDCAFASSLTNTSTFAINNTPSGTWTTAPRDSSDGWTTDPRDSDDEWTTVPR